MYDIINVYLPRNIIYHNNRDCNLRNDFFKSGLMNNFPLLFIFLL